jgi:hypothetical protein
MPHIVIQNYGSVLQAVATQKKLSEYCGNVELINCNIHNTSVKYIIKDWKDPIKTLDHFISFLLFKRNFNRIRNGYLNIGRDFYASDQDIMRTAHDSDIYITGSDQIWNTDDFPETLGARFLSFVPGGKRRFAFASSFGNSDVDDSFVARTRDWVHRFERIAVREDEGLRILEERYGYRNAIQLVDPTLAMPPEFWRGFASECKIRHNYILVYNLNRSMPFERYAKALSKKIGLPLVRLCHNAYEVVFSGKKVMLPSFYEFVSFFDNAEYVLTDSFHGAAFSMNLNTEPIIVHSKVKNPGRIFSFLRLVDEEKRLVSLTDTNGFDVLNRPVDFNKVNKVLDYERDRVDKFLGEIFSQESDL